MTERSERQIKKDLFCKEFFKNHKQEYTKVNAKGKTICDTIRAMRAMNEQWVSENGTSKKSSNKKVAKNSNGLSSKMANEISNMDTKMKELAIVPEISKEEVNKNLNMIASGIDPNMVVKLLPRPPPKKRL